MNEDIVKQIIIIRKDLDMPPGKLAVQVAHASMGSFLLQCENHGLSRSLDLAKYRTTKDWLEGRFRKIVLYVKSEEALLKKYKELQDAGFIVSLIKDAGFTVFEEPTITCLGVAPEKSSKIDPYTKRLQLLK